MPTHPSAIIYKNATIGSNSIVEEFAIVGIPDRFHPIEGTIIGDNSFIGSRCTIYDNVSTGTGFDISDQSTVFHNNHFGNNCRVGPKAVVKNDCTVGDNVRINANTFMQSVTIGSNVFIGPGVVFTNDLHPPCPKRAQCVPKTIVQNCVSIGANATISPGAKIGHNSFIYMGAVITKDVEPYSVMAGVPAKKINDSRQLKCTSGLFTRPFIWQE